jgi:putative ABC transport system permease protein
VTAAGGISYLPATGSYHSWNTSIRSGPRAGTSVSRRNGFNIQQRVVSGEVFAALDVPVLAGRTFDERDGAGVQARAVVSANFARAAFPGIAFDRVMGQRVAAGGRELEIIGVVGDVTLDPHGAPTLVVYHAHRQFANDRNWALAQVVAAERPPDRILAEVRAEVAALDPELVVHRAMPMAEAVGRGVSRERFALVLMLAFAAVSMTLAAVGLYGVSAYTVRQRTPEIGLRIALGATAGQIRALVLRQAIVLLATGVALGAAGALVLGRWLSSIVFQTSPSDPRIILATALLLTVTGVLAAWLPVRRASRVNPTVAIQI